MVTNRDSAAFHVASHKVENSHNVILQVIVTCMAAT